MSSDDASIVVAIRVAEEKLELEQRSLEEKYHQLSAIIGSQASDQSKVDALVKVYAETMRLMRTIEREISIDEVAGHSSNSRWLRFRASTAQNALQEVAKVIPRLRQFAEHHGGSASSFMPNDGAFSEMQRLVGETYPKKAAELRKQFVELNLPVLGFDDPIHTPRAVGSGASLEVGPETLKYQGARSEDIRDVLNGGLLKTKGVTSAPASKSKSADILANLEPPPSSLSKRIVAWFSDLSNKIVAGLIVAILVGAFGLSQCRHETDPSAKNSADPTNIAAPTSSASQMSTSQVTPAAQTIQPAPAPAPAPASSGSIPQANP